MFALSHGPRCGCRLVRACLGQEAIQQRKLECGSQLEVLGVDISFCAEGVRMLPSRRKREKWIAKLAAVLEARILHPGEASKLSGALNWACQQAFKRMGRAVLVPIRNQIRCVTPARSLPPTPFFLLVRARSSAVGRDLELSLRWFKEVLQHEICQISCWERQRSKPIHLYCDARGDPARIAAVILV